MFNKKDEQLLEMILNGDYIPLELLSKEERIVELKRLMNCFNVSKEEKEKYKRMLEKEMN